MKGTIQIGLLLIGWGLIFWGILHVKSLKDLATKKVLVIMTTIPVIILLTQLIIMIPRYVVYR